MGLKVMNDHFSEKPPSLDRLEDTLEAGSSKELWTEESPPRLPELPRRDLLDEGLDALCESIGVWSSSLNLAVAVTLVTLAPLGDVLLDDPVLDP